MLQIVKLRHKSSTAEASSEEDVIIDAARRLILHRGVSRTTLTDVAAEAGLSRMTVYRRWNNLPTLIGATLQREWERLLGDAEAVAGRFAVAADAREALVGELVSAASTLRGSELLTRVLEVEPQLMLPYLTQRSGQLQTLARDVIAVAVIRGQNEGSITDGDPAAIAAALVLTVQSFVVSMASTGDHTTPEQLDAELTRMLECYLRPAGAP